MRAPIRHRLLTCPNSGLTEAGYSDPRAFRRRACRNIFLQIAWPQDRAPPRKQCLHDDSAPCSTGVKKSLWFAETSLLPIARRHADRDTKLLLNRTQGSRL